MTLIRRVLLGVLVLVGTAATAAASPLTLTFSGSLDMTLSGGTPDNPFSGFFTWDTAALPFSTEPGVAFYNVVDYMLVINGPTRRSPAAQD